MAFYLKPPSGVVSLSKMEMFVMKRLAFLYYVHDHPVEDFAKIIVRESLAKNSECLIEGTVKDKISHFILRFLCASSSVPHEFFIHNETKLFSYRLQFCDFSRIQQILHKACEQSKEILFNKSYILKSYQKVLKSLTFIAEELELAVQKNKSFIKVPFTAALKFIKERLYPLHSGYITFPLSNIKSLFICLFEDLLVQGLNQIKQSLSYKELEDPRMKYLSQKIQKWIYTKHPPLKTCNKLISGYSLINVGRKFPLCMLNLHNLLLKHHRLKHVSRIQYTLFLKEIGVPSDDVIKLFRREYSIPLAQTCKGDHSYCSHNWTESEKRYIYSIEHLYGMRGARKNYKAHTCHSLQNSYERDGGCPFVTFDDDHLQEILKDENLSVEDIEDVASLVHEKKYNEACRHYLKCKVNICSSHMQGTLLKRDVTGERNVFAGGSNLLSSGRHPFLCENGSSFTLSSSNINSPSDFYSIISSYFQD